VAERGKQVTALTDQHLLIGSFRKEYLIMHALSHMQKAIRAEKEKHNKLVQEMRGKYKDSQESLASRFNDTLKLKENLEKKVKDLECEVDKLQPVCSLVGVCAGVCWFCGHHILDMHLVSQFTILCSHIAVTH
jgi:hypothetical protein